LCFTGYPDFYPSKGSEEEYNLSEKAITDGFENKAVVQVLPSPCHNIHRNTPANTLSLQNESSSSAQDTIGQSMLEKSTLQNLSQFILSVLHHRAKDSVIKNQTTFRVPPRVTLTDQKREQYLRDLANPAQSLRRLTRQVPHGIRGRLLLEQICTKSVPVKRAVWFIRVISVNELRAVKRKGLPKGAQESVETKWLIEWTGQVATFLENVIEELGKEKKGEERQRWSLRMHYTYLFVPLCWS
jgi:mediator of RNA polymerase II transcription subunit 12, fungi type